MYFDFDDRRPDVPLLIHPISTREGVLLSIIVHLLFFIAILIGPHLPWVKAAQARAEAAAAEARQLALQRQRENARFVFVAPRVDTPSPKPPPVADLSDQDRMARSPERPPTPTNPLPFARGNSPERVEALPVQRARGQGPLPEPVPEGADTNGESQQQEQANKKLADSGLLTKQQPPAAPTNAPGRSPASGGSLGDALKNLSRYVQQESYGNQSGGGSQIGPLQFDTKGVEFGPWVRRFIAQIKRNWFIPYAAMSLKGHVVLTFNVHRDGTISDLSVQKPSSVDAFTNAAYNALLSSNPTQPLPPEYPADKAFFTVTFYYNETPPY
jgi:TonB family protein